MDGEQSTAAELRQFKETLERLAAADRDNQVLLRQIVDGLERIEHRLKPASPKFVPTEPSYPAIGRRLSTISE